MDLHRARAGPTIIQRQGRDVRVRQRNALQVPVSTHLHGGDVPADSDGHPLDLIPPGGTKEYLLVIQDRFFLGDGSIVYPRHDLDWPLRQGVFGDVILVNGTPKPFLRVAGRRYRFRLLNGSQARVYRLALSSREPFVVVQTEGGFLPHPVSAPDVVLSPSERLAVGVSLATVLWLVSRTVGLPVGPAPGVEPFGQADSIAGLLELPTAAALLGPAAGPAATPEVGVRLPSGGPAPGHGGRAHRARGRPGRRRPRRSRPLGRRREGHGRSSALMARRSSMAR